MPWKYAKFHDTNTDTVLQAMRSLLNSLSRTQWLSAKIEASDQADVISRGGVGVPILPPIRLGSGRARGLVVWADDPNPPQLVPDQLGTNWSMYTWLLSVESDDSDNYDSMYGGLVNAFNQGKVPDGRLLSPTAIYYSRICMTNAQHGKPSLSLFWRSA